MNKKIFYVLLTLALIFPMVFSVSTASAASQIPRFFIKGVVKDVSVSVETKDFPANTDFIVMMGEYNTKGVNGIEVGQLNSGQGGAFAATFNIPEALKGRAQISIRMEGTGGWYSYNYFINDPYGTLPVVTPTPTETVTPAPTTTPAPTETPAPTATPKPVIKYPSFTITAVKANETVSIKGSNFPANTDFVVKMGKMWTAGIGGIEAAKFNSGAGGDFEATFPIPADLKDMVRISIRVDGTGGWYAYNWFWNNTTH
ncbi:MAG: hypothetical protein WBI14_05850 [Anaerolineaceae bacterium]